MASGAIWCQVLEKKYVFGRHLHTVTFGITIPFLQILMLPKVYFSYLVVKTTSAFESLNDVKFKFTFFNVILLFLWRLTLACDISKTIIGRDLRIVLFFLY